MTNKTVKVSIVPKIQSLEEDGAKFKKQSLPTGSIQSSLNPQVIIICLLMFHGKSSINI